MFERLPSAGSRLGEAAVVALVLIAFAAETLDGTSAFTFGSQAVVVVCAIALVFRRSHPIAVLLLVAAGRLFVIWTTSYGLVMLPVAAVALYTVARHGDRRTGLLVASAVAATLAVVGAAFSDDVYLVELLEEAAQGFLPIAVADAARSREDRVNDLIEAEATARVQAERLRIARDLHDVVAHGLSAIALHSGVAARLVESDPGQAKEALEVINATGRSSLEELRLMVGALRSTAAEVADETDGAPAPLAEVVDTRPTPADPNDVNDVIAAAARAGVQVSHRSSGSFPADVGDAVVVAIHRIVQESLMNVARHAGPVGAVVAIEHDDDRVRLSIVNEPPEGPALAVPSTGVGIIGMRERAESVGGTLETGPTAAGGFEVRATIPYTGRRP